MNLLSFSCTTVGAANGDLSTTSSCPGRANRTATTTRIHKLAHSPRECTMRPGMDYMKMKLSGPRFHACAGTNRALIAVEMTEKVTFFHAHNPSFSPGGGYPILPAQVFDRQGFLIG